MQNFDKLLGTFHQQEELLISLREKIEELTKTVNDLHIKTGKQEKTIKELSIKTATQDSEIKILRDAINSMKEYSSANSVHSPTTDQDQKRNGSYMTNFEIYKERQKMQDLKKDVKQRPPSRELRLLSQSIPDNEIDNQCAFYAYMNKDEHTLAPHHTLIFDVVKTNIGDSYNKFTGVLQFHQTGYMS
ncbi:uncharacterized protein LOC133178670 [Saccostrea echinata]|uniref:uncharacterized protein LOC133178670 n=1 Tax=Saccostrea echinata TaxID=191078 RepID=UPI002A80238F|nr:uncharacterized protein LOC133178670 [Saccostrea echinata]